MRRHRIEKKAESRNGFGLEQSKALYTPLAGRGHVRNSRTPRISVRATIFSDRFTDCSPDLSMRLKNDVLLIRLYKTEPAVGEGEEEQLTDE